MGGLTEYPLGIGFRRPFWIAPLTSNIDIFWQYFLDNKKTSKNQCHWTSFRPIQKSMSWKDILRTAFWESFSDMQNIRILDRNLAADILIQHLQGLTTASFDNASDNNVKYLLVFFGLVSQLFLLLVFLRRACIPSFTMAMRHQITGQRNQLEKNGLPIARDSKYF